MIIIIYCFAGLVICLVKNLRPNAGTDFVTKYLKLMRVWEDDDSDHSYYAAQFASK